MNARYTLNIIVSDIQGMAKNVPRRKLHFLINGSIFQYEIFYDYL